MALTDLQLKQAAPRERDWKLADGGGLYVLVRPNGAKLWRMKYRQDGKEKKLSLGRYPEIGLREARLMGDEARVEIGRGGDPARRKREEKIAAFIRAGDTFESVAHEYIAKREAEGLAMATLVKSNWLAAVLNKSIGNLSRPRPSTMRPSPTRSNSADCCAPSTGTRATIPPASRCRFPRTSMSAQASFAMPSGTSSTSRKRSGGSRPGR
jgi:hypothetical protein